MPWSEFIQTLIWYCTSHLSKTTGIILISRNLPVPWKLLHCRHGGTRDGGDYSKLHGKLAAGWRPAVSKLPSHHSIRLLSGMPQALLRGQVCVGGGGGRDSRREKVGVREGRKEGREGTQYENAGGLKGPPALRFLSRYRHENQGPERAEPSTSKKQS